MLIQTNLEPEISKETPPILVQREEDGLELRCRVTGRPRPEVTWFLNGNKLLPTVNTSRIQILEDRQLVRINYFRDQDEGMYECKAQNRVGVTRGLNMVLLQSTAEMGALYSNISFPVIVAVVVALVLVVILIIMAKLCYNRKKKTSSSISGSNSPPWKEPPTPPTPRLTQFELPLTTPPPSSHYSNEDEECRITLNSRHDDGGFGGSISPMMGGPIPPMGGTQPLGGHPCCNSIYASRSSHCHYSALPTHDYNLPPSIPHCQMSNMSMCDCQSTTSTIPRGTLERQFPHLLPANRNGTLRMGTPLRYPTTHRSRSHSPSRRSAEY